MEFKEGMITPTTTDEAQAFTSLLREQYRQSYKDKEPTPNVFIGQPLSETDSYRLFCAMERCFNNEGDFTDDESIRQVVYESIHQLAVHRLGQLEEDVAGFNSSADQSARTNVLRLAGYAIR